MPSPPPTPRLFSTRFWLSFVIIVAVSSMLPVFRIVDGDGNAIGSAGVYHAYLSLFRAYSSQALLTVLIHIAACFILAFGVRWNILRLQAKQARLR